MNSTSLTAEQVVTILAATPARIAEFTSDLTPAQLHAMPEPNGWSLNDLLAHIRSCADVWGDCIAAMAKDGATTLRAINPTTWIDRTDYPELDFQTSFGAFAAQRAELLALLKSLPPEDWLITATVTGAGAPLQRSVLFYAQWMARHERTHLKQVQRIASAVRA